MSIAEWRRRVWYWLHREQAQRELEEEMRLHIRFRAESLASMRSERAESSRHIHANAAPDVHRSERAESSRRTHTHDVPDPHDPESAVPSCNSPTNAVLDLHHSPQADRSSQTQAIGVPDSNRQHSDAVAFANAMHSAHQQFGNWRESDGTDFG